MDRHIKFNMEKHVTLCCSYGSEIVLKKISGSSCFNEVAQFIYSWWKELNFDLICISYTFTGHEIRMFESYEDLFRLVEFAESWTRRKHAYVSRILNSSKNISFDDCAIHYRCCAYNFFRKTLDIQGFPFRDKCCTCFHKHVLFFELDVCYKITQMSVDFMDCHK